MSASLAPGIEPSSELSTAAAAAADGWLPVAHSAAADGDGTRVGENGYINGATAGVTENGWTASNERYLSVSPLLRYQ